LEKQQQQQQQQQQKQRVNKYLVLDATSKSAEVNGVSSKEIDR